MTNYAQNKILLILSIRVQKKTYTTYMFKIIIEVVGVSPEASGDKNEGKIVEVECVRSFQDDKLFAKKNLYIFKNPR